MSLTDAAAVTAVALSKLPTVVVTLREGTRALDHDLAGMARSHRLPHGEVAGADAASAKYVGSPYPLIGGLQKLETWSKRIPMDASPATAHMFIIKPFTGESLMRLFSTHPSTEDRIARLQAMR